MCETQLEFNEGEEPAEFWEAAGGQQQYHKEKELNVVPGFEPRLFHVTNATGYMYTREVPAFTQEDLLNDDVYLLDKYSTVYIWVGRRANKFEVKGGHKTAEKYIAAVKDSRDKANVQIVECLAGQEPFAFTTQFIQWEPQVAQAWIDSDPLEIMLKANAKQKAQEEEKAEHAAENPFEGFLNPATNVFTMADIVDKFPKGIKGNSKEMYLSDAEFETVFGMNKAAWSLLKKWKQENKKKELKLF